MRWRPNETCTRCGLTLDAVGGRRIIASPWDGVLLYHDNRQTRLKDLHHPTRTARLTGLYSQMVIVCYGKGWSDDAVERAILVAQS